MTRLRPLAVLTAVAVSFVCLYFAVRDVDFELFVDTLREMSYWWILPSQVALAASVAIRVLRWRFLFSRATRPPAGATLRALLVGELFNIGLPFRTGELVRVVVLHREAGTSRPEALATALVERLLDVLVLLGLALAVLPLAPEVSWLGTAAVILGVGVALVLIGIFVLHRFGERPLAFLLRPLGRLPGFSRERVTASAVSLLRGFQGLRDIRVGLLAAVLTAAGWLTLALAFWLLMEGLHLELGFEAAVLVVVAITFSLILPSLPAGLGVFEAATLIALRPFDVGDSVALSCAVVLHVLSFAAFVVAGLAALQWHRSHRPDVSA